MSSRIRHYDFIDSLRAIAILGVIAVHTAQWAQPNSELLRRATAEGARGVQLFFVASAMTIFMSMKSRSALESAPVRNYFIRRFLRIAPLFYFGIVLWLLLDGFAPRYWAPNGIDGYTVLLTATFLHGFHPETITSLVPGGWSIAVEMMFYLIAPLMFRYIRDLPGAVAFFIAALLLNYVLTGAVVNFWLGFYLPEQQYLARSYGLLWFFAQLPIFALGMIAFHAMGNQFGARRRLLGYSLLIMVAILWIAFLEARSYYNILPPHVFYGASFVLLALALAAHPTRLLVNPVMRKVGKISFSLYIFHFVVLHMLDKTIFRDGFPLHGNAGFWAAWLLVTVISCAVSLFTYRYVERPGMDAGVAWRPGVGYLLLAVVLWIGFWMKLSLHLIDKKSTWMEPTGRFDFSPAAWDEVALVSTVGGLAVLCIGLLWRRRVDVLGGGRADWYTPRVRPPAWAIVIAVTGLAVACNEAFHIFHAGLRPALDLPWPLQGLFGWLVSLA